MRLLFQQAEMWPFLVLAAGPLIVHLLARTRPPVVRVPSLAFLRPLIRQTRRVKKPQDWILFLLRTLLAALCILMFLKPVWFASGSWAGASQLRTAVIVVDASASMAYAEEGQSRFSAAVAAASEILSGFSSHDRVNIIWMKHPPEAVFPEPGVNHAALRQALRKGQVTEGPGRPAQAMALANRMLQDAEGKKEVYLVSDFQTSQWNLNHPGFAKDVDVAAVQPAAGQGDNAAVVGLSFSPAAPLAGEEVRVYAAIENFSGRTRRLSVLLQAGEKRERQEAVIGAWSESTVSLSFQPGKSGVYPVSVQLQEDGFPSDDRAETLITIRPFLRVGLVEGQPDAVFAWRRVAEALPWARTEPVRLSGFNAEEPPDVIVAAGIRSDHAFWKRPSIEKVPVVWHPVHDVQTKAFSSFLTGWPSERSGEIWAYQTMRVPVHLEIPDGQQSLFSVFEQGAYGDPAAARSFARLRIPETSFSPGQVLMRYEDGLPALARWSESPARILWNIPLSAGEGTMQNLPEWVALAGELLLQSRNISTVRSFAEGVPGDELVWEPPREVLPADVQIQSPGGTLSARRSAAAGSRVLLGGLAEQPGLYTWQLSGQPASYTVIRFPHTESDLRCLSEPSNLAGSWVGTSSGSEARILSEGTPIWTWLLALCTGMMLLEGLGVWWAKRS